MPASTPALNPRDWRAELAGRRSRGSQAKRPGSHAGLAAARADHQGQFFTPRDTAALIWQLLTPAFDASTQKRHLHLIDTSCGAGALFAFATPDRFTLTGIDIDEASVNALADRAKGEGFDAEFVVGSLADARAHSYDYALLNPPFGLTFSSPNLEPLACTSFGRYGPHTHALSQAYAIEHALEAAAVVVAIVPTTFALTRLAGSANERLRAVLRLPRGSFASEGTAVDTTLLVYGAERVGVDAIEQGEISTGNVAKWGEALRDALTASPGYPRRRVSLINQETMPTIVGDVTGDTRCRITRNGRRLVLKFKCPLAQAKGLNAVLRARAESVPEHRHPVMRRAMLPTIRPQLYTGQGVLDVEVILIQPDPLAVVDGLVRVLESQGLSPELDPGLLPYLRRRIRRLAIESTPPRRWAHTAINADAVVGTARATHLERALDFRSVRVEAGQRLTFSRAEEAGVIRYTATLPNGRNYSCGDRDLHARFIVGESDPSWRLIHPGRAVAFPLEAERVRQRAAREGIPDFLTWGYQSADLIEMSLSRSDICSWVMGLGKSALSAALCLMGGAANAIIVPAHLAPEISAELTRLPIPRESWQVLTDHDQPLRRINVIAITRLRRPVATGAGRKTLARCLRRKFHTVVIDEAQALKNGDTDQTRAVWELSPKRRYAMSGSPINYPRDALQLVRWVGGDGTARNPYGIHAPYLEVNHAKSMAYAARGVDVFADRFITLEWVTAQFENDLTRGGKREIPRLKSPEAYREWLAPMLVRRLTNEPEVTAHIRQPTYSTTVTEVQWDSAHLATYLDVSRDFASWFREAQQKAGVEGKKINLMSVLVRIGAVLKAANAPHRDMGKFRSVSGFTSKQRAALDLCQTWAGEGRKHVVFAEQPDVLNRMAVELERRGLETVIYHGQTAIARRHRDLDRFRKGNAVTLLASMGAAQTGLNLPQASRAVFLSRSWSAITEAQCLARLLRPQQSTHVEAVFLELAGGIDAYQRQLVLYKADAARVGIDDAESTLDDEQFEHMDTILNRFVEDLEALQAAAA